MRLVAIPALLLLALAGLAVVPAASAAPPAPVCNGTIGGTISPVDQVTVFVSPPCYEVHVRTMSCPLAPETYEEVRVGTVAVRVYSCWPVEGTGSSSSQPCACPPPPQPQCNQVTTVGPVSEIVSVTVTDDCRVIVAILPYLVACNDPLDGSKAVTVGRVTVSLPCGEITACEPPFECYPTSASASTVLIPPVCIWKEVAAGPVKAGFDQCRQSHETTTCSNGSPQRIHHYEQEGPVYAQVHFCFPHSPPPGLDAASSDPGPCGAADPQQRCPAPVPMCTGISRALAENTYYSLSENCHLTIDLEAYCGLQGTDQHSVTVGKVTVNYQTCQTTPPQSAAMADPFPTCVRECSPIPTDSCELRQATPTTVGPTTLPFNPQHFVWGHDCDVDVEPIGACAPPSGRTIEQRIGPIDARILVCDGGIGDLGDWS